jgi:hypothetical protein
MNAGALMRSALQNVQKRAPSNISLPQDEQCSAGRDISLSFLDIDLT